ncbi:hypothetical protein PC9H_008672 [Pleurotus ostreatus]|uniref:Uncharacterized protein n=1 Tax=Pleurotus ostreatus TaxID=5322 RepID=A0A8H6ZRR2_PLEOS|nr:uncharacterized protein PC9H_010209 [Pleurotus ostreatus]XP_036629608.1 uncharacterized protein PC9H_008672 [Pleurotus ostreatus]KAF7424898.1 hypothetical protein PC9H_010209 [Pleurotus ostreatus]KAF7426304.1 hypothetical protein PC9H_008672 [Pleurotus ostreatus]
MSLIFQNSDICLAGVNLNVGTSESTRYCVRCGGDPPPVPSSSIVTKEVSSTLPQEATAARQRAGKKTAITGAARVPSLRNLKSAKAGSGSTP